MNGKTTFLFVLFCLGITHYFFATPLALFNQETNSFELCHLPPDSGSVFTVVEDMPEFPGGQEALFDYIKQNITYPKKAKKKGDSGIVYVGIIIEKNGSVSNVKVLRGVSEALNNESLRVVKNMPDWKPGMQRGKAVRVRYNLPVKFSLKK